MSQIHFPPAKPRFQEHSVKVFLAGTIDMGESINWQREIYEMLIEKYQHLDILNPRRTDWDNSWGQQSKELRHQIEWELDMLEQADLIVMVLLPESKSPISLLEMGAFRHKTMLVYCPNEFYRFANVEAFCKRNQIIIFSNWETFKYAITRAILYQVVKKIPPKAHS